MTKLSLPPHVAQQIAHNNQKYTMAFTIFNTLLPSYHTNGLMLDDLVKQSFAIADLFMMEAQNDINRRSSNKGQQEVQDSRD